MSDQVGKIEQLTDDKRAVTDALVNSIDLTLKQNTRIRELENEKIALLDQLADAGMEIKRLQESVREARREVFARIREKGYVVVPAPMLGSTGFATLVLTAIPDQDAIEREILK